MFRQTWRCESSPSSCAGWCHHSHCVCSLSPAIISDGHHAQRVCQCGVLMVPGVYCQNLFPHLLAGNTTQPIEQRNIGVHAQVQFVVARRVVIGEASQLAQLPRELGLFTIVQCGLNELVLVLWICEPRQQAGDAISCDKTKRRVRARSSVPSPPLQSASTFHTCTQHLACPHPQLRHQPPQSDPPAPQPVPR